MQMCDEKEFSITSLQTSSSISSWLVDFYFSEEQSSPLKNIIGSYDMWMICRWIQPSLSMMDFENLCRKKLKQAEHDLILDEYNAYLNRCGLIDLIDLMHMCRSQLMTKMIRLSMKNVKNELDQLFFEYLLELSSTSYPVDHLQTEVINTNITNSKNDLKHTLCMYLSLLLDRRNEYAVIHCLRSSGCFDTQRKDIGEMQFISKYRIVRGKECIEDERSSWQGDSTARIIDQSVLEKDNHRIKEFFDFLEQLQMIIEENERSQSESNIIFRQLLQLISKQLQMNLPPDAYHTIIEEFCQCFQTTISQMKCVSIQSASSQATLVNDRLLRAVSYLCAKQIIDLPILTEMNEGSSAISPLLVKDQIIEGKATDQSEKPRCTSNSKTIRKSRSLDLSIIHETSFEFDSAVDKETEHNPGDSHSKPIVKRQPLQQIDVNSFNSEERETEHEKARSQNSTIISLISDGDKENIPMITKKRSIWSTKSELPNKKQKKTNLPEAEQIPSFQLIS